MPIMLLKIIIGRYQLTLEICHAIFVMQFLPHDGKTSHLYPEQMFSLPFTVSTVVKQVVYLSVWGINGKYNFSLKLLKTN